MSRDEKLNLIARDIQSWLDFQERDYLGGGIEVTDSTHLVCPPVWPDRGTLKEWVKILSESDK